jgi:hypothetical protein
MATVAALPALFLMDAAAFRTPYYARWIEPDSRAGNLERRTLVEMHRKIHGSKQVLVVGDSRMGFLPRLANNTGAGTYEFGSVAVPGTTPRCWYYQVRDLDPSARRYAALLIPVDDYDDQDRGEEDRGVDLADETADLHYLIARLRLSDVLDFAGSYHGAYGKWQAFRGSLFKGTVYKDDLQAFLLAPDERRDKVQASDRIYASEAYGFVGSSHSLAGLSVDWETRRIHFPPGAAMEEMQLIESILLRPVPPQTGRLAAYRREWFGRIIHHYRGTATHVVFFRLPRGPVPRPDALVKKLSSSIRELAADPNVVLLNEHAFDSIERPELFMDVRQHLNAVGMARFTTLLARELEAILDAVQ